MSIPPHHTHTPPAAVPRGEEALLPPPRPALRGLGQRSPGRALRILRTYLSGGRGVGGGGAAGGRPRTAARRGGWVAQRFGPETHGARGWCWQHPSLPPSFLGSPSVGAAAWAEGLPVEGLGGHPPHPSPRLGLSAVSAGDCPVPALLWSMHEGYVSSRCLLHWLACG